MTSSNILLNLRNLRSYIICFEKIASQVNSKQKLLTTQLPPQMLKYLKSSCFVKCYKFHPSGCFLFQFAAEIFYLVEHFF